MKLHRLLLCATVLLSQVASHGQTALSTVQLSAGQKFGLTLRSDGSVWAWGTNQVGEVGLGTNTLVLWPTRIASVTNAVSISAGSLHSLAAQGNGTVWAWGLNSDGRLGNGNFNTASNPVAVTRITNAVMVSAGGNHSLALLANGSVMAWGANYGGQLGTGNTISTNQPVAAGNFTNAIAVPPGTNFSLALCQDGSVWAWGTNNMGQFGLGSTTTQLTPVKITTLSNIVQIAAGSRTVWLLTGMAWFMRGAETRKANRRRNDHQCHGSSRCAEFWRDDQSWGREICRSRLQQFGGDFEKRASVLLGLVWKRHLIHPTRRSRN